MLHSVVGALLLGHVLVFGTCATTPERTSASGFRARGWSEAGRRAQARWAWSCTDQTPPQLDKKKRYIHVGGRRSAELALRCNYTRLLCQQIHRGAQATDDERAECSSYESEHGRVSAK